MTKVTRTQQNEPPRSWAEQRDDGQRSARMLSLFLITVAAILGGVVVLLIFGG